MGIGFWYKKAKNYTEAEIRHAMKHTNSNKEAARYLDCHYSTYRRYASRYIDLETGKSLWDLHKNPGSTPGHGGTPDKTDIFEILEGKHPTYKKDKLKSRLLKEGIYEEKCMDCTFEERRITDNTVPLMLVHVDGDETNHKAENLKFICYNCYYLQYDDIKKRANAARFRGY